MAVARFHGLSAALLYLSAIRLFGKHFYMFDSGTEYKTAHKQTDKQLTGRIKQKRKQNGCLVLSANKWASRRYTVKMFASTDITFTHLYTYDLWPLTLKAFSAMPTHMMNMCVKFRWNPSNKYKNIVSRETRVNGRTTAGRTNGNIMPSLHTAGGGSVKYVQGVLNVKLNAALGIQFIWRNLFLSGQRDRV